MLSNWSIDLIVLLMIGWWKMYEMLSERTSTRMLFDVYVLLKKIKKRYNKHLFLIRLVTISLWCIGNKNPAYKKIPDNLSLKHSTEHEYDLCNSWLASSKCFKLCNYCSRNLSKTLNYWRNHTGMAITITASNSQLNIHHVTTTGLKYHFYYPHFN